MYEQTTLLHGEFLVCSSITSGQKVTLIPIIEIEISNYMQTIATLGVHQHSAAISCTKTECLIKL